MTSEALGKEIRKQIEQNGEATIPWAETDQAFDHIRYNRVEYIKIWAAQRNWLLETQQQLHAYRFRPVVMVN